MTHGIGFLPQCDQIVVMTDGRISEIGSYAELIDNDGAFAEFLRTYTNVEEDEEGVPGNQREKTDTVMLQLCAQALFIQIMQF